MSDLYPWDKSTTGRALAALHGPYCGYCDALLNMGMGGEGACWTIDHMTPRSKGGTNDLENLTLSCVACNMMKKSMSVTEFVRRGYRPDHSVKGGKFERHVPMAAIGDIALKLGVSTEAVNKWRHRSPSFPRPAKNLSTRSIWFWHDVEAWAVQHGRLTAPLAEGGQPVRLKGGRPRIHPVQS